MVQYGADIHACHEQAELSNQVHLCFASLVAIWVLFSWAEMLGDHVYALCVCVSKLTKQQILEALGKICKNIALFKEEGDFKKCGGVCFHGFYLRAGSFIREKFLIREFILDPTCKNS